MNAGYSDSGLPLGVQIIGPRWGEMELLSTAAVLEKNLGRPLVAEGGVR
jgi:aspartyl-tRNA(Asn)/glutamyl-tRNA(Gln) amidotransferase subunit A